MAKAKPSAALATALSAIAAMPTAGASEQEAIDDATVGYQEPTTTGTVTANPVVVSDKELIEKTKADLVAKKEADKAAKAEAKALKQAETDAAKAAKTEERAKAKAEREARIEALKAEGKAYTGSMLSLADRVKQGVYVKGATGQLRSNDDLAVALDGVAPTDVITIALDVLGIEENPYHKLNTGQQSMNLRNRMRGAIKKETLTIATIQEYIARNKINVTTAADLEARAKEKADKKAKADAEKQAKAEAEAAKGATTAE